MKKSFTAIILILCLTSAVNAESPWVLWEAFYSGLRVAGPQEWACANPDPEDWQIVNAFPNYDQCMAAKKDEFKRDLYQWKGSGTKFDIFESITIKTSQPPGMICVIYKCLPTTIDPRK